jgi:hypothetical protein
MRQGAAAAATAEGGGGAAVKAAALTCANPRCDGLDEARRAAAVRLLREAAAGRPAGRAAGWDGACGDEASGDEGAAAVCGGGCDGLDWLEGGDGPTGGSLLPIEGAPRLELRRLRSAEELRLWREVVQVGV